MSPEDNTNNTLSEEEEMNLVVTEEMNLVVTEKEVVLDDISPSDSDTGDMVPEVTEATDSGKERRSSAPRLSIGAEGLPQLDVGNNSTANLPPAVQMVMGLCMCVFGLACAAAGVSAFVFTIKFLIDDEGKGGSCAKTTGKAIWVYVIVRLCVGSCSSNCQQQGQKAKTTEAALASYCCYFIINLGLCIYGGIVLFNDDVCDSYKRTGLYQMYSILYWVDVASTLVISTCGWIAS